VAKYKTQHYLPACYLYGFTSISQREGSERVRNTRVWSYDIRASKVSERPIRNVATRPYLYSFTDGKSGTRNHRIEEMFSGLETAVTPVLQKAEAIGRQVIGRSPHASFTTAELNTLLDFVFYMMKRSPAQIEELQKAALKYFGETSRTDEETKYLALATMLRVGLGSELNIPAELRKKNMHFFFTDPRKASWITSDQPFVRFNKHDRDGIGVAGTEMYFPVCSGCLLALFGDGRAVKYMGERDPAFVRYVNKFMVRKAKDLIVASSEAQLRRLIPKKVTGDG